MVLGLLKRGLVEGVFRNEDYAAISSGSAEEIGVGLG
jgi:hypothetical protein